MRGLHEGPPSAGRWPPSSRAGCRQRKPRPPSRRLRTAPQADIVGSRSEDNSADFLGAYGSRLARTPTLGQLAREGVRYGNRFSIPPACAPSKPAILTSGYEAALGPGHQRRAVASVPSFGSGSPSSFAKRVTGARSRDCRSATRTTTPT
ncbi:sulfatase-like hydrolase/transferase [Streptomyces sp. DH41]|uniref:sulfatase-like hydrolase/transferase n=1 Tax=Streptomyces sp. DH41 TaxID=3040125 RepID=UPI003FA7D05F